MSASFRHERAPLRPIVLGFLWLSSLRWKLPPDFAPSSGPGLMDWLMLEAQYPAFERYGRFVDSVVIPNFTPFAWIIFLAELLVGLSLLSGTLTRLSATVGLLMALNLGIDLPDVTHRWPRSHLMPASFHWLSLMAAAGRLRGDA